MTTEKLINECQAKIELCDKQIGKINEDIRSYRNVGTHAPEYLFEEKKVHNAQRQCYVQFIADLETLSC